MIWSDIWQDIFFQPHLSEKQEINQLLRGVFAGRWFCRGSLITELSNYLGLRAGYQLLEEQLDENKWLQKHGGF